MPPPTPLALLLVLLPIIHHLLLCSADDIFVAPNGDDVNGEGSLASPYRTMQRAIDACLNGDTIIATAGIYRCSFPSNHTETTTQLVSCNSILRLNSI
jgi:hypothetical protein